MVTSVTFPETGNGYIYEQLPKPYKPNKHNTRDYGNLGWTEERIREESKKDHFLTRCVTPFKQEKYDADMAQYEKEMAYYCEHKGEYILPCSKLLRGRMFEFSTEKINVIFGPNGCGKTTILKAIAGEGYCLTGFNKVADRFDRDISIFSEKPALEKLLQAINDTKKNTANVEWTGNPIYYHNFSDVEARHGHEIGGLMGTGLFGRTVDELIYMMDRDRVSAGQKTTWLFNKLVRIVHNKTSLKALLEGQIYGTPDEYASASLEHFSTYPDYDKEKPMTLLLDELDKSLDIESVCTVYRDLLPGFQKEFGTQIILVSHSPIFVMSGLRNDDRYNIIDMDEEYSQECINNIKELNQ